MKILAIAAALLLSACSPQYRTLDFPLLPEELKDCKFFVVSNGTAEMRVVRCPNSSTTTQYRQGKVTRSLTTIDGDQQ